MGQRDLCWQAKAEVMRDKMGKMGDIGSRRRDLAWRNICNISVVSLQCPRLTNY